MYQVNRNPKPSPIQILADATSRCSKAHGTLRAMSRCLRAIALWVAGTAVLVGTASRVDAREVTASFTDSQGRTMLYRYSLESLQDSGGTPGLLLYFHGNVTGSERAILNAYFPPIDDIASTHQLVPVVVASPDTNPGSALVEPSRVWLARDRLLIHEFLQTGLPSQFSFDRNRIVFWGSSAGTIFLSSFLRDYGGAYGGGYYASCGSPVIYGEPSWPPDFKNRFRVVIHDNTNDYRWRQSLEGYVQWKYRLGFETLGDLSNPGYHCEEGKIDPSDAVGWILGTREVTNTAVDESRLPSSLRFTLGLNGTERTGEQSAPTDCPNRLINGDGGALWMPPKSGTEATQRVTSGVIRMFLDDRFVLNIRGMVFDATGNLYAAGSHNVWRIEPSGAVETIAGTGRSGYSGDGGAATEAQFSWPSDVAVDEQGNLYVADLYNDRIRRIDRSGKIETLFSIPRPTGVAVDAEGTLYVSSEGESGGVFRRDITGSVSRLFTTTSPTEPSNQTAGNVAVDTAGNVYTVDFHSRRVLRIDPAGVVTVFAGTGERGYSGDGGPAIDAKFDRPGPLAVDGRGNVYVADYGSLRIRQIDPAGVITTFAGTGERSSRGGTIYSGDGGPAIDAGLAPGAMAVDPAGNLYVKDSGQNRIRVIDISLGEDISLSENAPERVNVALAETGGEAVTLEHDRTGLLRLCGVPLFAGARVTAENDTNHRLSQQTDGSVIATSVGPSVPLMVSLGATQSGVSLIDTFAGSGEPALREYEQLGDQHAQPFEHDGIPATLAALVGPFWVASDAADYVYVSDSGGSRIHRIDRSGGAIMRIAGTGILEDGEGPDGRVATSTGIRNPIGVAVDATGNVYFATRSSVVRRINHLGVIETIAGTPYFEGFSGDGGPAADAILNNPRSVVVDTAGNLYIGDYLNHRIRRIDTAGVITTIAGNSTQGFTGDGGPATAASLNYPEGVALDSEGNVYVADCGNRRIRRIDTAGVITTIAGNGAAGYAGDGGPATAASLGCVSGIAIDSAGNVYLSDTGNHRIRRIDTAGVITTIAGNGAAGYAGDGGPAIMASLAYPRNLALDSEGSVLYVADDGNRRVRVVTLTSQELVVPLGLSGDAIRLQVSDDGRVALFGRPLEVGSRVVAANGRTYALDHTVSGGLNATYVPDRQALGLGAHSPIELMRDEGGSWRLGGEIVHSGHRYSQGGRDYVLDVVGGHWRLASHMLRTVAGHKDVADGVSAAAAKLYFPSAVAIDSGGNIYLADRENDRIRRVDAAGKVTTFAGTGDRAYEEDGGPASRASLDRPSGVAVDAVGNVYIADTGNHRVRRIDLAGTIETLAGTGLAGDSGDGGPATSARMRNPIGVAVDAVGNVYIADTGNHRVRRIDLAGTIETLAGTGLAGDSGDGGPATSARMHNPIGVAVDVSGGVFVADFDNHRIRRIDPSGMISPAAGTGSPFDGGDGGPAALAQFSHALKDLAVNSQGWVYVVDSYDHRVRAIDPTGTITTFAGTGSAGFGGDGGMAPEAQLNSPDGISVDTAGNVYLADTWNHRLRKISMSGVITTIAGTGEMGHSETSTLATDSKLSVPKKVALDADGNVYLLDAGNHRVVAITPSGSMRTVAGTETSEAIAYPFIFNMFEGMDSHLVPLFGASQLAVYSADPGGPELYVGEFGEVPVLRIVSLASGRIEAFIVDQNAGLFDGLSVDESGNLYIADRNGIRKMGTDGSVTVIAESSEYGFTVGGLAVDPSGNVWFTDPSNRRVNVLEPLN